MSAKKLLLISLVTLANIQAFGHALKASDRETWLKLMDKVARPVIENLAADQLHQNMQMQVAAHSDNPDFRKKVGYLEAFGRTLSGIAPWLQQEGGSANERKLREQYRAWCLKGISNAFNPNAKDYMTWTGGQPLVDASFVALGFVRAPWLWANLDETTKQNVVTAMKATRTTVPVYSNWILFSGMIEAFMCKYDLGYDPVRVEFGIREFTQHWYVGDGLYSDGMDFHFDYYNSIVIQPFLSTILETINAKKPTYVNQEKKQQRIGKRYAELLERLINSDGTYPVTGRSITYRSGVFHHLADMALKKQLPDSLNPAQVRGALTAMLNKTLNVPNTYDDKGWLRIGLSGAQPALADFYITTGSLYLCCEAFVALGLDEADPFWSTPAAPWTAVKAWSGQDVPADHAVDIR